jgi:hypothetical protein
VRTSASTPLQVCKNIRLSTAQATLTDLIAPIISVPTTTVETVGAVQYPFNSSVFPRAASSGTVVDEECRSAPRAEITSVTDLIHAVSGLMLDFVVPTADALLNLSASGSQFLTDAVIELSSNVAAALRSEGPDSSSTSSAANAALRAAILKLATALLSAEKEVFYLLVSGPVFRLVQRNAFSAWAAGVLSDMSLRE